jgi:cytidylate kinase
MNKDQVIALDGPSGSGKSTVAKLVASKLGIIYIDTGAMFRAAGFVLQNLGIDFTKEMLTPEEEKKISIFFSDHQFHYARTPDILIELDQDNLTEIIREHQVSKLASQVSKHKVIRNFLASWQRQIVKDRPAILDGRDIGTVIFPQAKLKVFLTASSTERAQRRYQELISRGQNQVDFEMILKDIEERDAQDMNRELAPLRPAQDSVILDSTGKSIDQIVSEIIHLWNMKKGNT